MDNMQLLENMSEITLKTIEIRGVLVYKNYTSNF